jgi:hypothetical protein
MAKMTDDDLLAIIEIESQQAQGVFDETSLQRKTMIDFYMGEAVGDLAPPEIEGRSRVVSKDMMDTVEWMMPSLMRMFASSDDAIRFEPTKEAEEQMVKDASDYVEYIFWRKNPGFRVLHDAIKNCLIQRQSFIKVYCDETWDEREETYEDISGFDVQLLQADPQIVIVSAEPIGEVQVETNQGYQMDLAYKVVASRRERVKAKRVEGVPPEELRYNRSARTIEEARFVQHKTKKTVSDLLSIGYPQDKLDELPDSVDMNMGQYDRQSYGDEYADYASARNDQALREVEYCETYIKVDFDDDGIAEYRRVVHSGNVIFENEKKDDHCFAMMTPILMPYKAAGLSMWDLCEDLQRIRTALTRQMLDNAYLANDPQRAVVEGQVKLDDLLNPRPGGIIRVQSLESMRTDMTPFIGTQVLTMLDHFGQVRDKRTGVTEFNQGLGADSLSKTSVGSEGAQSMMDAAMQRVELIARVIAETALARVWLLILKESVQYADREEEVKVNGRWLRVNPREWKTKYGVIVNIGTGTTNQRQKVMNVGQILAMQEKAGPFGLATPQNAYAALTEMTQAMGYRDADRFFTNPETAPQPQDPGPPPEVMLEQMKQQGAQQLAQVKAEADIEVSRMEQEYQAQESDRQKQLEAERDRQKSEQTIQIEQIKADNQAAIEQMKIEASLEMARMQQETAVAVARINAEAKLMMPQQNAGDAYAQP